MNTTIQLSKRETDLIRNALYTERESLIEMIKKEYHDDNTYREIATDLRETEALYERFI